MYRRYRGIMILTGILMTGIVLLFFPSHLEVFISIDNDHMGSRSEENWATGDPLFADMNTNSLISIQTMDMDEIFRMDPKEEPEKGLILIGLGIAIIFIVLAAMRYYKKKSGEEKEIEDETEPKRKKKEKREIRSRTIETDGEDTEDLSLKSPAVDSKKSRKKKHPDKVLIKAREKLQSGGSYARKNAIKVLRQAVTEDPDSFSYIMDGLAASLEDKDKVVVKGAMKIIEEGMKHCPDDLEEIAEKLVGLLDHSSEDISQTAKHLIADMAAGSAILAEKTISVVKEGYKLESVEGEAEGPENYLIIEYNELLVEVGKKRPELIPDITNILTRCFTYPIYRPEQGESEMEELYKSAVVSIAALSKISPSGTAHSLPKIMKVAADTNTFESWKNDKDDPESMRSTFERVFETVSSSDPESTMEHILKGAAASNKPLSKLARDRIGTMAGKDPERVFSSLVDCLGNQEEKIRKNALNILDEVALINPALSINIILRHMSAKNELVLSSCAALLKNLLDRTGDVTIGNIAPILALTDNPSREVRQSVLVLLGKIVEKDLTKAPQCIEHIIKGLKQEWGVRLMALSSLETLSRADPNLRNFSIPYFIESLADKHDQVRWRASNILRELGVEETDIKHFESAQKLMDFVTPKLKELHLRTSLDLSDIKTEIARTKEMMKLGRYGAAETHAGRAKEMFLELQVSARPELDIKLLPGTTFVLGEHTAFTLALTNTGMVHIDSIDLGFSADVEIIEGVPLSLNAGATKEINLALTPSGSGRRPLKVRMSFRERGGTEIKREKNVWLDIRADREDAGDDVGGGVSELVWE